jgi:methyl-accepting chemotaxis protein
MMDADIERAAARMMRIGATANWAHPVVAGLAGWTAGTGWLAAALSLALAVVAQIAASRGGATGRLLFAMAVMGQPALMVGALTGHPWQADAHMYFFALLATLAALSDAQALIAGAAVVALHHLSLTFAVPALVFPGGGDSGRVLLHAFILTVETVALAAMILQRHALTAAQREAAEAARRADAEAAETELRAARARQETMRTLEAQFTGMVERGLAGAFGARLDEGFEDPELRSLAQGLNRLYAALDRFVGPIEAQLGRLAEGDLTGRMREEGEGAFRNCAERMDRTLAALSGLVGDIAGATQSARGSAEGIAGEAGALSESVAAQAAAVEETAAAIAQIAASGREQATGVAKVSSALNRIDAATQSNAALAQRTADAAQSLAALVDRLDGMIAGFRVEADRLRRAA